MLYLVLRLQKLVILLQKLRTHPMTVYLFRPEISKPTRNLTDRNLNKLPY